MHAASNSCQYSLLTTVIALMQKVEDSGSENSRDVLFVAVAVYLWSDKRYVASLLTKSVCSFPYMRTCLNCVLAGEVRLFPDDVSDTCSNFRISLRR